MDLSCAAKDVTVAPREDLDYATYEARGCGRMTRYTCHYVPSLGYNCVPQPAPTIVDIESDP
jgi:hypothetical protein